MMTAAKAWIALAGAIITAVLSSDVVPVDGNAHVVVAILSVLLTALATYKVPNTGKDE